ncbi:OstA-like protein [Rubrolithibacter danxiaensis]|uniref:OstA-like protein n=1 Tax=Rubrolithibacter danxiaensis TaxID=3390805 RepID=UPI003BF88198
MRKIIYSLLFLFTAALQLKAQQIQQVQLVSSEKLKGFGSSGLLRVIKPVFSHEGSTLSSDSATFNQDRNTFDAYGNVVITQPNGTTVYSDLLNYNGNTRIALLTKNVRLVDKDAILTTEALTYNMATRVGTYTGGGKIVNAQNVLTSKNGYYFSTSRDAYFRYNVEVNTPQALIKCDTLKYNSETKIAYFFGPTNIMSKEDSTNLYTENGDYNTLTDQARFGKNNLYTDGSKTLQGDSLFYDKQAGYGRAVKNITFIDTAQKIIMKGNLGIYRKADESTLVTKNPYIVLMTQDSASVDSIWLTSDTLFTKVILKKDLQPLFKEELKKDTELEDPTAESATNSTSISNTDTDDNDTSADEEINTRKNARRDKRKNNKKEEQSEEENNPPENIDAVTVQPSSVPEDSLTNNTPEPKLKEDSLKTHPDSAQTKIVPEDNPPKTAVTDKTDTPAVQTPVAKENTGSKKKLSRKERRRNKNKNVNQSIPTEKNNAATIPPTVVASDSTTTDTTKLTLKKDSIKTNAVDDTAKTRIIMAYHKVKIFKSDLQAKADSAFYSYTDSTIRCYRNPIIWTQGSQLSADTVYLQLKNRKLDNMLLQNNGFIVNTEKDSTKFNQIKGKVLTGYFKDNKMDRMFVDGNAESIYYVKEDSVYTGMNRSVSSRIKVIFEKNELKDIIFIRKPEMTFYPIEKIPKDTEILKGFIWKPKERPKSKEEIIPVLAKKKAVKTSKKAPAKPAKKVKQPKK